MRRDLVEVLHLLLERVLSFDRGSVIICVAIVALFPTIVEADRRVVVTIGISFKRGLLQRRQGPICVFAFFLCVCVRLSKGQRKRFQYFVVCVC